MLCSCCDGVKTFADFCIGVLRGGLLFARCDDDPQLSDFCILGERKSDLGQVVTNDSCDLKCLGSNCDGAARHL